MKKIMTSAIFVPIDGTLRAYALKMGKSGFTPEDGFAILKGDFASYKDCIVGVVTSKDLVRQITVTFPERDTWSSLSCNYFSLKETLTEKYGKPSDYVEKFDETEPSDNTARMYEVQSGRCKYYTTYETDRGGIQLSIEHDRARRCSVQLAYYDKSMVI